MLNQSQIERYRAIEHKAEEAQKDFLAADVALSADRNNSALRHDWQNKMTLADELERERMKLFDDIFSSDRGREILRECGVSDEAFNQSMTRRAASRNHRS